MKTAKQVYYEETKLSNCLGYFAIYEAGWNAALAERDKETCEWKEDGDIANSQCGSWSTAWDIRHRYCQFCGKRIKIESEVKK